MGARGSIPGLAGPRGKFDTSRVVDAPCPLRRVGLDLVVPALHGKSNEGICQAPPAAVIKPVMVTSMRIAETTHRPWPVVTVRCTQFPEAFMRAITDHFGSLLRDYDLPSLDAHDSSVVGVDEHLRIGYLNAGWFRFAAENDGEPAISGQWGLGANLWEAIPLPLQDFYRNLFATAVSSSRIDALHPLLHDYECSSPDNYRRFTLSLYPLRGNQGLLLVHSLRVQTPWGEEATSLSDVEAHYRAPGGMIRQCANCRRVKEAREDQWHYVSEWIGASPPKTSHGLCPICLDFYWPGSREN